MTEPTKHEHCESNALDNVRMRLLKQHVGEILSEFVNDNVESEQAALKVFVGTCLERLVKMQKNELAAYFDEGIDELCPGCLTKDAADLANLHSVTSVFNNYLAMASLSH